jgi:Cu/Ag efflux pump CusA
MAMVILGGLISSTFLNIFVVPILYRLITKNDSEDSVGLEENRNEIIEE